MLCSLRSWESKIQILLEIILVQIFAMHLGNAEKFANRTLCNHCKLVKLWMSAIELNIFLLTAN